MTTLIPESPVPLYYQLKELLRERIENGEFKTGDIIPTEKELEIHYQVSRSTIRHALDDLVNIGLLNRKQGIGTFVSLTKVRHNSQELLSFSQEMSGRGLKPGSRLIKFTKTFPDEKVSRKLNVHQGDEIFEIHRIRYVDGKPVGLHTSYLPAKRFNELSENDFNKYESLYELLNEKFRVTIVSATEELDAVLADKEAAILLDYEEGLPLLRIFRVAHDDVAHTVEFVKMLYRPDMYKYQSLLDRK